MKRVFLAFLVTFAAALLATGQQPAPSPKPLPKTISGGVLNGKATSLPAPPYPAAARAVRAEGTVTVQVLLDEGGNVVSASAVSGHPLLRAAAESAARQAAFSQTFLSGTPVKISGVIVYNFKLPEPKEPSGQPDPGSGAGTNGDNRTELLQASNPDIYWSLGMVIALTVSKNQALVDEIIVNESYDDLAIDLRKDFPGIDVSEKAIFDELKTTSPKDRPAVLNRLFLSAKKRLTPAQAWQADVGEQVGAIAFDLIAIAEKETDDNKIVDTAVINANLKRIKALLNETPEGVPANIVANFKKVGDFADMSDLGKHENILELWAALKPMFDTIENDK